MLYRRAGGRRFLHFSSLQQSLASIVYFKESLITNNWFDVDKAGLAQLMAGRSKAFVIYELLQNAWDQNVSRVDVTIEPVAVRRGVWPRWCLVSQRGPTGLQVV
jgi:hypothetical protein